MVNICCSCIFILLIETTLLQVGTGSILNSIKSEDGDIIDCVDIYKQPAFAHPALKNHKIQLSPTYSPRQKERIKAKSQDSYAITVTSQLWHKRGRRCSKGTIPLRRSKEMIDNKNNKIHTNRIFHIKKKPIRRHSLHNDTLYLHEANHSLAILLAGGFSYSGARGDIKVYNPWVEADDEYTTSRIALKNGPTFSYEAVEAGWAVNPSIYGDKQTRLFVYWTSDGSKNTGCFDVTCPGFVQVDNEIALGAAIYPISKPGGLPYQISIYIYKDPVTSNWWVNYGGRTNIGYWPPELFNLLSHQANIVQWGGEVYSTRVGTTPHTATGMGSGRFPDFIFGTSGWVKGIRVQQNSHELMFPEFVSPYTDEYRCYDVYYVSDYIDDPEFYYGGPGRNDLCP